MGGSTGVDATVRYAAPPSARIRVYTYTDFGERVCEYVCMSSRILAEAGIHE